MHHRLERLQHQLRNQQLDALLITSGINRQYLSGFTGSAGVCVITPNHAFLLSDSRYATQAVNEAPAFEFLLLSDTEPLPLHLSQIMQQRNISRLGFEANDLSVSQFNKLQQALQEAGTAGTWTVTEGLVESLRVIKDAAEIALLRRAVAITDDAFAAVRPLLRPTMRESEVAWELEKAMRERGADGLSFEIIVACGPHSALPHARAGNAQLGEGRPIVMDFGAKLGGYHADMTRTVVLGQADEQFWRVYNTVRHAQQAAVEAAKVGMLGSQADAVARDAITEAGFGEAFGHGLGHGVGLQIHEAPAVRRLSQDILSAGMVFSIEPGVYLPEWGGVRIEDLVLLTDNGSDVLTHSTKEPVVEI
jgi:Xaa-Pro aminopeptidase